jgi:redox-sensitive bicupin YhaK (pirin superfamily)
MPDTTVQALQMHTLNVGSGAHIDHLVGSREQLDPFIMADHFRMWQPTFGPHPHAGFSAVTYLFDDAQTGFRNRDSRGQQNHIAPGDLHWTLAGAGVLHEEVPLVPGDVAHGLQLFVNLPAQAKHMPPAALHVAGEQMPRFALGDATVKLVFGQWPVATGTVQAAQPMPAPGDATLLDVWLPADSRVSLQLSATQHALLITVEGHAQLGGVAGGAWALATGAGTVLQAGTGAPARVAVLAGTPWREPLFMQGPFGMASAAEVQQAMLRYRSGEMGSLAPLSL